MPTYDYLCPKCEAKFEVFHPMNDKASHFCPTCKTEGKKTLSAVTIIYNGSGFYTTDYCNSHVSESKK